MLLDDKPLRYIILVILGYIAIIYVLFQTFEGHTNSVLKLCFMTRGMQIVSRYELQYVKCEPIFLRKLLHFLLNCQFSL